MNSPQVITIAVQGDCSTGTPSVVNVIRQALLHAYGAQTAILVESSGDAVALAPSADTLFVLKEKTTPTFSNS